VVGDGGKWWEVREVVGDGGKWWEVREVVGSEGGGGFEG
jgi:hypothetical protein